jgi:neopullulanase
MESELPTRAAPPATGRAPPDWVADAVFYQIFPDRFAASARVKKPPHLEAWESPPTREGFKGGDLLGIVERLDHLEALGVNAIYLNPVFASGANHRYHTYDYYQVDPLLGGNGALRELLDAAHARGMRVILDGVFNHAGRGFWPFHHLLENGPASPYRDWFRSTGWPLQAYGSRKPPNYEAWWGLRALPKLNVANPDTRAFLLDVAEHWIRFGADGWRLDVPAEIAVPDFWPEFRRRVRAAKPDAYLVGEIWDAAPEWVQGDRFDALMNYPFARAALGYCAGQTLAASRHGSHAVRRLRAAGALAELERLIACYPPAVARSQLNLLGSHDTPRFLTLAGGDHGALHLAVLLQMTLPGAPCIYYGDEVGMEGGADPDCRRAFPWEPERWHEPTWKHFRRAAALRRRETLLRRGGFRPLPARSGARLLLRDGDGGLPGAAGTGGGILLVALNAHAVPARLAVELPADVSAAAAPAELWAEGAPAARVRRRRDGAVTLHLEVAPRSGRVLRLAP